MQEIQAPSGRPRHVLRWIAIGVAVVVVVAVGIAVAFRNVAALAVLRSAARGFGYDVAADSLDLTLERARIDGLRVRNAAGENVLTAKSIAVGYSLRDLLPGGKRLFGLTSVAVAAPFVTVIHHRDGTYNVTLPKTAAGPAQPNPPPLDIRLRVSDGTVVLIDRFVNPAREHRETLADVHAAGIISPARGSYYHAGATLHDGGRAYPIRGNARFDDPRGFELQHWTAARLPIAALANFALSTHAITVEAGEIRALDLTLGALSTSHGTLASHLGLTAQLTGARVAAAALAKPIRNAHGALVVGDDSATVRSLDAQLNGIRLHLSGALFDFAAPQVAFAVTARGDLGGVAALTKDTARLPLAGAVALQALAEGPASSPLVIARVSAPQVRYGTYRFDAGHGFVALSGNELDIVSAAIRYGPVRAGGRAAVTLAKHTQTSGYAALDVAANGLPYVDNIVPGMPLSAIVAVNGSDARLAARGYLRGADGSDRLDAPFALDADGSGTVGPVVLQRHDGASVFARAAVDRRANQTVALLDVRRLSLLPAPAAALPGLALPKLPPKLDARLDASLSGIVTGTTLASAGGTLHAYGNWGDVRADADGSASRLAAQGRVTSSFERLAPFTGNVGAHGGIDVPFALTNAGRSTILQIRDARFPNAAIRGVALQGADATLGIGALPVVDVYAADVRVAGSDVTAAGRFGNGGHVHITAADIDLRPVRAAGVPISGGRATLIANIGGTAAKPTAEVAAAVSGARYAKSDLGGDVGLAYNGSALTIDRATLTFGGAYASATGTVGGLAIGHIAPRYDLEAQLEDADVATLARTVKNPLRYPEGTIDANLHVAGSGSAPSIRGVIRLPEGSINGLDFSDARIGLAGSAAAIEARGGHVTVGSTTLDFGGSASRSRQSVRLRSDRIDLADFNDYFDEAEVLAGTGSAALAFNATPRRLDTTADVTLHDARYRRFRLGSVDAHVNTVGTAVRIKAAVDGVNGRITAAGSITVPASDPLRDIVRRSYLDLQTGIAGINLGSVLPAAGLDVPVFGVVNGAATVRGRYPALSLATHAALTNGVVGRVPIDRFTVAATASNGRGRLTEFVVAARGISASASGTFGVRPDDPFDLQAQTTSPDLAELIATVSGKDSGVKGSLATRSRLTGTLARPRLTTTVDADDIAYKTVTIPSVHAELDATRSAVDIRNGSIALPRSGSITFDGHAPLSTAGPATPIALDFVPHHVDVGPYSSLLPDGSVVEGVFDGNVGVRGTLDAPRLNGELTFSNGSFRSDSFKNALTQIALDVQLSGTAVRIVRLHARAAPGSIDGSGTLALRDLRDPVRGLTANVNLTIANAYVSAPKYYAGTIDGTVSARKRVAAPLNIGGNLTFSSARIPYTALTPSGGSSSGAAPALPDVAFDLGVNVGRDVRIQSGPVDIGAAGSAQLGGTLAKPTLNGQFTATDGTVSLYRTFNVQNGSAVNFAAADGITPTVDATATTSISDPPTDILLRITGPSTHLHLAFSSEPAYSQQQILGLLIGAQSLGAVSGLAQNGSTTSNGVSIAGIGEGLVNTQLTQKFLQPFTSKLGSSLGLSDLNVGYNVGGGVSATARRKLGKNVSFTYGEQIGGPSPRTSLGINIGTDIAGAQLTIYQANYANDPFGLTPFQTTDFLSETPPNYELQSIIPPYGSGFVASYVRKFW